MRTLWFLLVRLQSQFFELLIGKKVPIYEEGKSIEDEVALAKQLKQDGDQKCGADQFEQQSTVVMHFNFEVVDP